jgi:hypothetical protein
MHRRHHMPDMQTVQELLLGIQERYVTEILDSALISTSFFHTAAQLQ